MNNKDNDKLNMEIIWNKLAIELDHAVISKQLLGNLLTRAFESGKLEKDTEDTVINGWVARDKNGDLYMYTCKPERNSNLGYWDGNVPDITPSNDLFPDLTWESEPEEIEIIIKRKKNELLSQS